MIQLLTNFPLKYTDLFLNLHICMYVFFKLYVIASVKHLNKFTRSCI